jgi:hypothetical protein
MVRIGVGWIIPPREPTLNRVPFQFLAPETEERSDKRTLA